MITRIATTVTALLVTAVVSLSAMALSEAQRAEIEDRIRPVGEVCLEGDSSCGGPAVAASSGPRSGQEVYDAACMACHTTGAAGAPRLGEVADWTARIDKGMDVLYASGVNGVAGTGMIAKGGCMNCSDEEVNAAVDYMVQSVQ